MKFVILHHGACTAGAFHYLVRADGEIQKLLGETAPGIHPRSIGIVVEGDCDVGSPEPVQLEALRTLLVRLKTRYPSIALGGHRQVRGEETTCPGRQFPLTELRAWAEDAWVPARDAAIARAVEDQYTSR